MPKKIKPNDWKFLNYSDINMIVEDYVTNRIFIQDKSGVEWTADGGTFEWDEVGGKRENFNVFSDSPIIKNKKGDPYSKEFHQPNIIKVKVSLKGEASLKGTLSVKGKAIGEVKPPLENKEPDPFEKKLELWGRILPKKIREEYFGDLLEDRAILEKRGLSKRRVNMVTLGKILFLLRAAHWEWLEDLVTSVFESIKKLIP